MDNLILFEGLGAEGLVRPLPNDPRYLARLERELSVITEKGFEDYFRRVVDILVLTRGIPHMTRGSAASSLLCYLLGISHLDPVKEGIRMERFLHAFRPEYPDVDLDFPWDRHKEVHEKVLMAWPGQAARISTRLHHRARGAVRAAMRELGYKRLSHLDEAQKARVQNVAEGLVGRERGFSKHVGGVVVLGKPFSQKDLLTPTQLRLDKDEVKARGWWKIDLLSSRALGQLLALSERPLGDYPEDDPAVADLLTRGDLLGLTQGESPAFRKLVMAVQPRGRRELGLCLALLRPAAASRGRKVQFLKHWRAQRESCTLVYEDDANDLIASVLGCPHDEADMWRRAFAKRDKIQMALFKARLEGNPRRAQIIDVLTQMKSYAFCKAHAMVVAQLLWALAWHKAHNLQKFWCAALNHNASMYRAWVLFEEVKRAGWSLVGERGPWKMEGDALVGADRQPSLFEPSPEAQYIRRGWWRQPGFLPGFWLRPQGDEVVFRGLVATGRPYRTGEGKSISFVTVGTGGLSPLLDLVFEARVSLRGVDAIEGRGVMKSSFDSVFVQVSEWKRLKIVPGGFEEVQPEADEIGHFLQEIALKARRAGEPPLL